MVHHSNDDAMNKIPLKSASGLDDEEKNGGELMQDTAAAEEARREQMHANVLAWMKKLTIGIICFIGISLICYVIFSLVFNDWPKSTPAQNNSSSIIASTAATETITAAATVATTAATVTSTTATNSSSTTATPSKPSSTVEQPWSQKMSNSEFGVYKSAAVCSDRKICSDIGSAILARNGSAVDATVATMLCNGLNTLENLGIGGGLVMNIYERSKRQGYQVDARSDKHRIAVPGEIMGYYLAHQHFGKLSWRELVEPSLEVCRTGFIMNTNQENIVRLRWESLRENSERLKILKNFVDPASGQPYVAGSILKPPVQLCNTYQLLADNGAMDFYNGTIAKMLAEDLKELGSTTTQDDLAAYSVEIRWSAMMSLGNDTLYGVRPEDSESVVSNSLTILEDLNLTRTDEDYNLTVRRFNENLKFLLPEEVYSTSVITIIAPNGDAVSASSAINSDYNSLSIGPRTGISLNAILVNRLPTADNEQLMTSQSPTLLVDDLGNVRLVVGVAGVSDTVEVIARLLWLGEDIRTALETSHNQFKNDQLSKVLESKGLNETDNRISSACVIERNETAIYAKAFDRKGGGVAGF